MSSRSRKSTEPWGSATHDFQRPPCFIHRASRPLLGARQPTCKRRHSVPFLTTEDGLLTRTPRCSRSNQVLTEIKIKAGSCVLRGWGSGGSGDTRLYLQVLKAASAVIHRRITASGLTSSSSVGRFTRHTSIICEMKLAVFFASLPVP